MNNYFKKAILISSLIFFIACSAPVGNENTTILINTSLGDIKILLYDNTPVHHDNFIKLVKSGFYSGISFHRVIKDFMIQTGDPETRSDSKSMFPDSLNSYTIPAEFRNEYFHKRGAVAAARMGNDVNPEMRSSGTQFYIVQGVKLTDEELDATEQRINNSTKQSLFSKIMWETSDSVKNSGNTIPDAEIQEIASLKMFKYLTSNPDYKIPDEHRNVYKRIGGVPRLDGSYTVFGEVIDGMDVVDRIAEVETDDGDRPVTDVKILKIKIVK